MSDDDDPDYAAVGFVVVLVVVIAIIIASIAGDMVLYEAFGVPAMLNANVEPGQPVTVTGYLVRVLVGGVGIPTALVGVYAAFYAVGYGVEHGFARIGQWYDYLTGGEEA